MEINLKAVFRWVLISFYLFAGLNHFINPEFYFGLIPDYLPAPQWINYLAGFAEVALALAVIFQASRKLAIKGIIVMLIAFIPSHVYFIQIGSCVEDTLCVAPWMAWLRLLVVHPLLIWWAWALKD